MSSESKSAEKSAPKGGLPLFYEKPEVLHSVSHSGMRLSAQPDFRFALATNSVPIMASEFPAAGRFYPIVLTGEAAVPVAVLGLGAKNLFVKEDGSWDGNHLYIPAYVRRYPFTFIQHGESFILGVDMACERLMTGGKGYKSAQPLFSDGAPASLTKDALKFCGAMQTDHLVTKALGAALAEEGLLIDQMAKAVSESGRHYDVQGFRIVDFAKLQKLSDTTVADWHRKGWLALIYAHLASALAWKDLVARTGALETVEEETA